MHGFHMLGLLSHFYQSAGLKPLDGTNPLNYGFDKVRVLQPVIIGEGIRIRSHISLLNVIEKDAGQKLLATSHELEVQGLKDFVLYAEYLTYWFPLNELPGKE